MYRRRRRRPQEVGFSFDSFLDVVANVVGIIIRLILVVWVGARSYSSLHPPPAAPVPAATAAAAEPRDPLEEELARQRQELEQAEARLLDQLRQLQQVEQDGAAATQALTEAAAQRRQLEETQAALRRGAAEAGETRQAAALSLDEVRQRCQNLVGEIRDLEKQPPPRQVLRYQTPVSRPVHSEELYFECRRGRVTLLDVPALLAEVKRGVEDKAKELRSRWEVTDVAGPVGAFQLRWTMERERGLLDGPASAAPDPEGGFRYGLSRWVAEPVTDPRGEGEAEALAAASEFRRVADHLNPPETTVTFWVYPDSFALFRRLRDYLYERDVIVAGRPLPDGVPIASSRQGTVSRGQ